MSKSALIVVDMVRDFTDPQGLVYYPQNREILPRIAQAVERCRAHGMTVVFMQHCYRADKPDRNLLNMRPNCLEGSGGEEIDPMLPVDPLHDYVIKKRRYSAFFGTDLDLVLRENGVENVIIVGTKTNCCIRATVTDAYYLNYHVIVPQDAVATNSDTVNQVHLEDIRKYFGEVATLEKIYARMEKGQL
ncbi:MAG: isochorismatase family cysteine hydrolase [Candidatus Limiplasma sp.]|nr:isochorismatase family cysteine hydrolase [Candidatus Limiplasma sp.]